MVVLIGSTLTAVAAIFAWIALVAVGGLRALGAEVSLAVAAISAALAGPIAITASIQAVASIWRGPDIESFSRGECVLSGPGEADAVRAGAQLRGTMGGAGHLYRRRLALPAIAWLAAAVAGVEGIVPAALELLGGWPAATALIAAFAAFLLPSRPFYYREVTGGGVLVSPAPAAIRLAARARRAALSGGAGASSRGDVAGALGDPERAEAFVPEAGPERGPAV